MNLNRRYFLAAGIVAGLSTFTGLFTFNRTPQRKAEKQALSEQPVFSFVRFDFSPLLCSTTKKLVSVENQFQIFLEDSIQETVRSDLLRDFTKLCGHGSYQITDGIILSDYTRVVTKKSTFISIPETELESLEREK